MFDTHCHLNFKRFKKNLDEVISRAFEAGVTQIVIPGTDVISSKKAIEIAENHEGLYVAVGIHPHHAAKYIESSLNTSPLSRQVGRDPHVERALRLPEGGSLSRSPLQREYPKGEGCSKEIKKYISDDLYKIENLLSHPNVVAVGEVGMDRHTYKDTKYEEYTIDEKFIEIQRDLLRLQIQLAVKHKKSLIVHNREAIGDILPILEESWNQKLVGRTVFHCCEPNLQLLAFAQKHKIFIGVDGDVTYDKAKQAFIKEVPLEILVVETDSPFILPEPLLSQKKYPNEPANVRYVVKMVAQIKNIAFDEVIKITTENGKNLFQL